jgi:hypothetical protein
VIYVGVHVIANFVSVGRDVGTLCGYGAGAFVSDGYCASLCLARTSARLVLLCVCDVSAFEEML